MIFTNDYFMKIALREAARAAEENEIPVGAVVVRENEIILIDCGAVYEKYHGDMTRIFVIGELPEYFVQIFDAVEAAYKAALNSIGQGVTVAQVDAAARASLAKTKHDTYFTHSTGHGVGLDIHEPPRISQNVDIELKDSISNPVMFKKQGFITVTKTPVIDPIPIPDPTPTPVPNPEPTPDTGPAELILAIFVVSVLFVFLYRPKKVK